MPFHYLVALAVLTNHSRFLPHSVAGLNGAELMEHNPLIQLKYVSAIGTAEAEGSMNDIATCELIRSDSQAAWCLGASEYVRRSSPATSIQRGPFRCHRFDPDVTRCRVLVLYNRWQDKRRDDSRKCSLVFCFVIHTRWCEDL